MTSFDLPESGAAATASASDEKNAFRTHVSEQLAYNIVAAAV